MFARQARGLIPLRQWARGIGSKSTPTNSSPATKKTMSGSLDLNHKTTSKGRERIVIEILERKDEHEIRRASFLQKDQAGIMCVLKNLETPVCTLEAGNAKWSVHAPDTYPPESFFVQPEGPAGVTPLQAFLGSLAASETLLAAALVNRQNLKIASFTVFCTPHLSCYERLDSPTDFLKSVHVDACIMTNEHQRTLDALTAEVGRLSPFADILARAGIPVKRTWCAAGIRAGVDMM